MIERPEAVVFAKQMAKALRGLRVVSACRENSPHKWAFYNRPREAYARIPKGKRIGRVTSAGSSILVPLEPGYVLQLGDGGERIVLLDPTAVIPKKYHLLWVFADGKKLVVSVHGWGMVRLLNRAQYRKWQKDERQSIDPVSRAFTYDRFCRILDEYSAANDKSIKAMLVNRPRIRGIGNGYLQDILFRAGLHPTRKTRVITKRERRKLYHAIRSVLSEAIAKGGRDDEFDLYDRPGKYVRTMANRTLGKPCPRCRAKIARIQYLGGACYFCPKCQKE